MKIPWPAAFEEGDIRSFLRDFEAVAELVGVKEQAAKAVVLGTLLRGRAKAAYDSVDRSNGTASWKKLVERLVSEFDSETDRQLAMQQFRSMKLGPDGDPLVLAVKLTNLLRRALPTLDEESEAQLLSSQFIESVPDHISQRLKLVNATQPMDISELAKVTRQLLSTTVAAIDQPKPNEYEQKIEALQREVAALKLADRKDRCFECGKPGHWRRYCPERRKRKNFRRYNACSFFRMNLGLVGAIEKGALYSKLRVNDREVVCLIDTGAAVSLIDKNLCKSVNPCSLTVQTVGGYVLRITGRSNCTVVVGGCEVTFPFIVVPELQRTILGADFLREIGAIIDTQANVVITKYGHINMYETSEIAAIKLSTVHNVTELINKYDHLFTGDGDPYGYCDKVNHEIPLSDPKVRSFLTRRVPCHLEGEVERQVQEMLKDDIIEEADSPYNSPVLLVKKANGKYRFCVDFRQLNSMTELRPCAMPTVIETLDRLQGANVFSVLDLRSGYWQIPIKQSDRDKTAFIVGQTQYRFKRMPFGLAGAPFTFRRLMKLLLKNLKNVEVYGDDLVIYSQNENDHVNHVEAVLRRIEEFGLRVNKTKSQIAKKNVTLLGHKVGNGEIKPLPEKILTIKTIPAPNSKRKLRQFLGRAAFYSRFVKNFNEIAAPLYRLLGEPKFVWSEESQRTFDRIKQLLDHQQMTLKLPVPGRQFTVCTDASDYAIGAVLRQDEGIVEYASRVLTLTERKYSTIEKECLAMVWAVDKWRPYLLGRRFHIETDHKPLQFLKTARDPRGKLSRWMLRLQEYDFTISHVPGSENVLADLLSRPEDESELPEVAYGVHAVEQDPLRLARRQRLDDTLNTVIQVITNGIEVDQTTASKELTTLLRQRDRLRVNAYGTLTWRENDGSWLAVIPQSSRHDMIEECHQLAHTGVARTTDLLRQSMYWPGMREDVARYVLGCPRCQLMKGDRYIRPPLQSIPVTAIGDLWSVDVMGPFPQTSNGNQYLLVMTEHATRWVDAVAIPDQRARTVTDAVVRHIVADHGVPKTILTDQGPCFESEEFTSRLQQLGIKRIRTTPYHPQTNGLTERNNRTLKEWLASKGGNWETELPLILLTHRATTQETTKKSPFQLMYGRKPRLPVHNETWPMHQKWSTTKLKAERKEAVKNVIRKQRSDVTKSQMKERTQCITFAVGDQVKCRDRRYTVGGGLGSRKLLPKWEGPYTITKRRGQVYTIRRGDKQKRVNASQLQRWVQWDKPVSNNPQLEDVAPRRSERLRTKLFDGGTSVVRAGC
uniref:RNA-directed DNA polymerase n=2 Tax=Trichobilharzia regenti TaxID=157069 RepID=A0AA85JWP7_TRIRE|nr:unnamed protein product [Trichobilharzia regenti]